MYVYVILTFMFSLPSCLHVVHRGAQVIPLKMFHVKRNRAKDKDKVKSLFRRSLCKTSRRPVFH